MPRLPLLSAILVCLGSATIAAQAMVVLENAHFRYVIRPDGRNLEFVDRRTGVNYLAPGDSPCAMIRSDGRQAPATSARLDGDRLQLEFGGTGNRLGLRIESRRSYLRLVVETMEGPAVDAVIFLNVPLTLQGRPTEPFGGCAFSLNLITRVDHLPALQPHLRAQAERKFGVIGAKVALVGMPVAEMLPALREVLTEAEEMPPCRVAGPWASEVPFNRGSYLFNFGSLVETEVDDWIGMARSLGFTQIDNHGGGEFFRFGDFELNRTKWPEGWDGWRRIVDRLHAAGIGSIFHSYAFFIDKRSRYVTPVPDPRLDAFRVFTLTAEIGPDATEIPVEESTAGLSTVTGFFEHNSVLLHLGDELVTFDGFRREAPWRFTGVKRGALGTRRSSHAEGTRARHLKECFGLLVPNPESSLFEEIAANHADVVNRAGFDAIYLDAIDGSSILRGPEECWYWADKFVFEIQKRLRRPVGMEMSAMWHHFWQYRTRWQAWDLPQRGHERFVDLHAAAIHGGLLLPLHLGWWGFQTFQPPQIDPSYPEVIEHLGARLVGWDAGVSLAGGVDRGQLRSVPLFRRAAEILRICEELRHSGELGEAVKARLRDPAQGFTLYTNAAGRPRFRRMTSHVHRLSLGEPWTLDWKVTNGFEPQPLRFRLEALMTAPPPNDTNALRLADLAVPETEAGAWEVSRAPGVEFQVDADPQRVPGGTASVLRARSEGRVPRPAAWSRLRQRFPATRDLRSHQALGFWVEGDGQGELLAVRLESPVHLAFGAIADRYVSIDFTGPRFVTLVETESSRWSDYTWNDRKSLYNVYRETVDFGVIESVEVWLQSLPPGSEVRCRVGPILALPMVPATLRRPVLTLRGESVELDVELRSGQFLEYRGAGVLEVFGPHGESLDRVPLKREFPRLNGAVNELRLTGGTWEGAPPRARVTVFTLGEEP